MVCLDLLMIISTVRFLDSKSMRKKEFIKFNQYMVPNIKDFKLDWDFRFEIRTSWISDYNTIFYETLLQNFAKAILTFKFSRLARKSQVYLSNNGIFSHDLLQKLCFPKLLKMDASVNQIHAIFCARAVTWYH